MKYLKQFAILAAITCAGELMKFFIPLPIPGSIYGLLLLLGLLMTGALKVEQVREAAEFLIEIMPVMFIPAAAGLMISWKALSGMLIPVCVITLVSTFVVMGATGKAAEAMLKRKLPPENGGMSGQESGENGGNTDNAE